MLRHMITSIECLLLGYFHVPEFILRLFYCHRVKEEEVKLGFIVQSSVKKHFGDDFGE